ncbi:hypothetical protein H1P_10077 [Hyella patelloides LEGE 07179]|uniref:Uncharacterized protein n=1 Tax=Hyella patelloides LEGE 07179 TaxID=945734 RepID=A0A563VIP4_9CYAN|nr:hypothetical protein H1P_10077 [Hyella patelloides LEGE 07179]
MGRLQPTIDNCWQQNLKPEKSPLSTPASTKGVYTRRIDLFISFLLDFCKRSNEFFD